MNRKLIALLLCTVGTTCLVSGQTAFAQTIESNDAEVTSDITASAKQLKEPEEGWKRYEDSDEHISYTGGGDIRKNKIRNGNEVTSLIINKNQGSAEITFSFTGTKLRLIGSVIPDTNMKISLDGGKTFEKYTIPDGRDDISEFNYVIYEKTGLTDEKHDVVIRLEKGAIDLNAIDIDGELN